MKSTFCLLLVLASFSATYVAAADSAPAQNAHGQNSAPAAETASQAPPTPAKKKPAFSILEYQITGNTLLDNRDIERALEPFLGESQTVQKIELAAKTLERLYRAKGFPTVFVNIPEQDIRGGVVRMDIVEGKVQRMRITGAEHYLLSDIRKGLPAVKEGETLHLPTFQQQLSKINARSQHLRVTPVLKAGKYPGSVEVELKVKDELPVVTQLAVNNHNSANTTPTRIEFNTAFNNLWQKDHGISMQWQTSPENTDEVGVYGITYLMRGLEDEHRLAVYAVKSDSQIVNVGGQNALTILGAGNILGLRYIIPFPSTTDFLHSLSLGFDYKDFSNTLELAPKPGTKEVATKQDLSPITYGVWALDYSITTPREHGSDRFNVGVRFGTRGLNDDQEFASKRKGESGNAQPNFAFLTAGLKSLREIGGGWQVQAQGKTQISDMLLIGNEQMSSGGYDSVRGYFQSEVLGDQGVNLSVELRTPSLFKSKYSWLNDWRFLTFVDGGHVEVIDPAKGEVDHYDLSSAGVGMRLRVYKQFSLAVDAAQAMQDGSTTAVGDTRVDAEFRWEF